jgi:hypothetical protein
VEVETFEMEELDEEMLSKIGGGRREPVEITSVEVTLHMQVGP